MWQSEQQTAACSLWRSLLGFIIFVLDTRRRRLLSAYMQGCCQVQNAVSEEWAVQVWAVADKSSHLQKFVLANFARPKTFSRGPCWRKVAG